MAKGDNQIHLTKKIKQRLKPGQLPVVKLTVEAYDTLIDIANITGASIKEVASDIIMQSVKLIVYDEED